MSDRCEWCKMCDLVLALKQVMECGTPIDVVKDHLNALKHGGSQFQKSVTMSVAEIKKSRRELCDDGCNKRKKANDFTRKPINEIE